MSTGQTPAARRGAGAVPLIAGRIWPQQRFSDHASRVIDGDLARQ